MEEDLSRRVRPPGPVGPEVDIAVIAPVDDALLEYGSEDRVPLIRRASPQHRGSVVYACFLLLGLATLLPWNFFITAETYWQYKFRNASVATNESDVPKTSLQELYTPMQVCLSQIPNFVFLFINALFSHLISQRVRLLTSLTLMIIFFSLTTTFTQVDTDNWQMGFFALTMVIIILINSAGAIFQGGLFGVAGMFPEKYMTAVVSGQALGGVFASLARIISLSVGAADANSAFIYFMIAVAVMILTLATYIYMANTDFYKHYTNCHRQEKNEGTETKSLSDDVTIFKEIWPVGLSVWGVFAITLAAFPALCVTIKSTSDNETWADVYFQPVVTFLLFNVGDYLGRQVAGMIMWPKRGSKILYLMVILRLVFIPLFLFCNKPGSSIPSVFAHDAWYIIFMLLFALSNGYCSSLCMTYGPKLVSEDKAEKASSMMAAMLGLGLLSGGMLSFAFKKIAF